MFNKKLIVLTIMFVSLLAVSAVSAEDNSTSDVSAYETTGEVASVEQTQVMEITDNEIISDDDNGNFTALQSKINNAGEGSTITLENNYTNDGVLIDGIQISKPITINGNGHVIDAQYKSQIFTVTANNVILNNITFINGNATFGGAICNSGNLTIKNCIFTNNSAVSGGAIANMYGNVAVENNTFKSNVASYCGGAIYFEGVLTNVLISGNFIDNVAKSGSGGANYFMNQVTNVTIIGNFTHNRANSNCNGSDKSGSGGANCFNQEVNGVFISGNYTDNVGYRGGANFLYKDASNVNIVGNYTNNTGLLFGGVNYFMNTITNVTIGGYYIANKATNRGGASYFNKFASDVVIYGEYINNSAAEGSALYFNRKMEDVSIFADFVDQKNSTIFMGFRSDSTLTVNNIAFDYNCAGSSEISFTGATSVEATITNHSEAIVNVTNGTIIVSGLDVGIYTLTVTTIPDEEHDAVTKNVTVIVNKLETELSASEITTTYNINKDLVITLKDTNGNPINGVDVIVNLNGEKTYITDKNGQIKVSTEGLAPSTYIAEITFKGTANYAKATKSIKVTVKKATPKMTVKTKSFKKSVKTKKYKITLKTNQNKVIKNAKVTINVNKKTYIAKSNNKGVVTFKITKLTEKGKYTATVTYNGNYYYNNLTKKVKITVK